MNCDNFYCRTNAEIAHVMDTGAHSLSLHCV